MDKKADLKQLINTVTQYAVNNSAQVLIIARQSTEDPKIDRVIASSTGMPDKLAKAIAHIIAKSKRPTANTLRAAIELSNTAVISTTGKNENLIKN